MKFRPNKLAMEKRIQINFPNEKYQLWKGTDGVEVQSEKCQLQKF